MSEIRVYRESGTGHFVYDRTFFGSYRGVTQELGQAKFEKQVEGMAQIVIQELGSSTEKRYRLWELDDVFVRVSPSEYRQALQDNWAYASLTHFDTDAELAGYQIFCMQEDEVYYSISPQGEIAGVIDNEKWLSKKSTRKALDYVIPHALEHGGTWLTCWGIGLPSVFSRYEFHITQHDPYDLGTYGEPSGFLKQVWACGSWNYGDVYPHVVMMRHTSTL